MQHFSIYCTKVLNAGTAAKLVWRRSWPSVCGLPGCDGACETCACAAKLVVLGWPRTKAGRRHILGKFLSLLNNATMFASPIVHCDTCAQVRLLGWNASFLFGVGASPMDPWKNFPRPPRRGRLVCGSLCGPGFQASPLVLGF